VMAVFPQTLNGCGQSEAIGLMTATECPGVNCSQGAVAPNYWYRARLSRPTDHRVLQP